MTPRWTETIARLGFLAILAGTLAGCAPNSPQPQTVTPTASSAPGVGDEPLTQPPRQIATH